MLMLLYLLVASTVGTACAIKILVFSPAISQSHLISNSRIAETLAEAGHDVTLLEVTWIFPPPATTSLVKKAKRWLVPEFGASQLYGDADSRLTTGALTEQGELWNILGSIQRYHEYNSINNRACAMFLDANRELFKKLRSERFDAYFGEMLTLCGSGMSSLVGIPIHFWVSSTSLLEYMGWLLAVPTPVSYTPVVFESTGGGDNQLGYWHRVGALVQYIGMTAVYLRGVADTTHLFRERYGDEFPDLGEAARESPLVFVNTHELVDFPRPTLHNIIHIGGLGIHYPGSIDNVTRDACRPPIQEPFASEYVKGKLGVVYFSLGTIVSTKLLPAVFIENLLHAFSRLSDFHFIVKVDQGDERFEKVLRSKAYGNIYLCSWAPQPELFAGGRVRAFITHGGYNSLMEAAINGIPLIGMGFFADQFRNARLAARNGWGVAFAQKHLLEGSEKLEQVLQDVLYNEGYTQSAKRISRLLLNYPIKAEERLVRYVKFVAEAGGGRLPELQVEGRHLSLVIYYNLDIIIPFGLLAMTTLYIAAILMITVLKLPFKAYLGISSRIEKNKVE